MAERRSLYLREQKSVCFCDQRLTPEFRQFMELVIWPHLHEHLPGYKRAQKLELATNMVNMLIWTRHENKCVADTRDTGVADTRLRIQVWDAIIAAGYAHVCVGSELAGKVTRYVASDKLIRLRKSWPLDLLTVLHLDRNSELEKPTEFALVVVHSGKVNPCSGDLLPEEEQKQLLSIEQVCHDYAQRDAMGQPHPRAVQNGIDHYRGIENVIERINHNNISHSWLATCTDPGRTKRPLTIQPNVMLRRVYSGPHLRTGCGRLYTKGVWSAQAMSKEERRTMLIDREPVAELDFSGMLPRLAYYQVQTYVGPEDVYRVDKVFPAYSRWPSAMEDERRTVRDFVKRVTNICLNTRSEVQAVRATIQLLRQHEQSEFLNNVISEIEGLASPRGVVARIQAAHPTLAPRFFQGWGMELMSYESNIMIRILLSFTKAKKPVLPIHDAVVCKASDVEFATKVMSYHYEFFTFQKPVIKREF